MLSRFRGSFILDGVYLTVLTVAFSSLSSGVLVFLLVDKITGVVDSSLSCPPSDSSGSLLCGKSMCVLFVVLVLLVVMSVESLLVESGENLLVESGEYLFVAVDVDVVSVLVEVCGVLCVEVVVHWHVVEVDGEVDLRTGLRLVVDVVELDREVDVGVSSRIEESVFVQSDSVIEHPGECDEVASSWVLVVFFDLHPQSLQELFPSTNTTWRGERCELVALLKMVWVLSQYGKSLLC